MVFIPANELLDNKEIIKKVVKEIYKSGGFSNPKRLADFNSLFQEIGMVEKSSNCVYDLIKTKDEKFQIYNKYYAESNLSDNFWGKRLKQEYNGSNNSEAESKILELIKY